MSDDRCTMYGIHICVQCIVYMHCKSRCVCDLYEVHWSDGIITCSRSGAPLCFITPRELFTSNTRAHG